jgi:hypothetical protein
MIGDRSNPVSSYIEGVSIFPSMEIDQDSGDVMALSNAILAAEADRTVTGQFKVSVRYLQSSASP